MDLVVYQMMELKIMHVADGYRAVKILSGPSVPQPHFTIPRNGHSLPHFPVVPVL